MVLLLPIEDWSAPTASACFNDTTLSEPPFKYPDQIGEPRCESIEEAYEVLNRFLSAFAWATGDRVWVASEGIGGHLGAEPRGDGPWCHGDPIDPRIIQEPEDPRVCRALAYFREGLGLNSNTYCALAFAKIINIGHDSIPQQEQWIDSVSAQLDDHEALARRDELQSERTLSKHITLGKYLMKRCRGVAAHATEHCHTDPDSDVERQRIGRDLPLLKAFAALYIRRELKVETTKELLIRLDRLRP